MTCQRDGLGEGTRCKVALLPHAHDTVKRESKQPIETLQGSVLPRCFYVNSCFMGLDDGRRCQCKYTQVPLLIVNQVHVKRLKIGNKKKNTFSCNTYEHIHYLV